MLKNVIDISRTYLATLPFMCHQLPERSCYYNGSQFPVCARCTGVIIGQLLAIISIICLPIRFGLLTYISLMLPALVDWAIQEFMKIESNNHRRIVTGSLLGFGYAMTCFLMMSFAINYLQIGDFIYEK